MCKSNVLSASFSRRQLSKQFYASLARPRFHTAWDPERTSAASKCTTLREKGVVRLSCPACWSSVRACRARNTAYTAYTNPGTGDPDASGRDIMLTRRAFAGVTSCAICGLAGFLATDASAQGAQPATSSGGGT